MSNYRAALFERVGEYQRSLDELLKAYELDPRERSHFSLGVARFEVGDFKGAAGDLLKAIEEKDYAYSMLLRYIARARVGEAPANEIEANAARLKTRAWPYAVVELYLGKRSPGATLDAAGSDDDRCEAAFYVGQWHLLRSEAADAEKHLRKAAGTCRDDFIERRIAAAELKRLGGQ